MIDLRIVSDAAELSRAAAAEVARIALESINQSSLFSVALSGGSTPRAVYALLAEDPQFRNPLLCERIHFFWGDERAVPPDHPESNFRMTREAMLSALPVPPENVHRIHGEFGARSAAEAYDAELRSFFHLSPGELPRMDLVLLGMGADGHTASLFPHSPALREQERLAIDVSGQKLDRITLTPPALNHAVHILFLVSGSEKADTLKAVLEGEHRPDQYPAQLIRPRYGKLVWMVDQSAAAKLSPRK